MATKTGTSASETITGTSSADTLWGRGGHDLLKGLAGGDKIYGEGGNDTLVGGLGNDRLDGGTGADLADWRDDGGTRGMTIDLGAGTATRGSETDTLVSISSVRGTNYNDLIRGDGITNKLNGAGGDDTIFGQGGNDYFDTHTGNDYIDGGDGVDTFDYSFLFTALNGYGIQADLGNTYSSNVYTSTHGNDTLRSVENVIGSQIDDYVYGDGAGNRLEGREGYDQLYGYAGSDILLGGPGNDRLAGGAANDTLNGAGGNDTFELSATYYSTSSAGGRDIIEDFHRGEDYLYVYAYDSAYDSLYGFSDLDTNGSGVLGDGDQYARNETVTHNGVSLTSTIIDVGPFMGTGEQSLVTFGVTGLAASDFIT